MKFCIINLNSLLNKVSYVSQLLVNHSIDIVGLNETWLTPEYSNAILNMPGYSLERADSPEARRKHGVAFYIKNCLSYKIVETQVSNIIIIHLTKYDIYLVNVYRPPSSSPHQNQQLIVFLTDFCTDREVLVMGDFNLPSIQWLEESPAESAHPVSPTDTQFLDCFTGLGLTQVVRESTIFPSGNILDLILFSHEERFGDYEVLPPLPGCCHSPVTATYVFQRLNQTENEILEAKVTLWSRGKYNLLSQCLQMIDWEAELHHLTPDDQYQKFLNIIEPMIAKFVPKVRTGTAHSPPWSLHPPRELQRAKSDAWKKYKSSRTTFGRRDARTTEAFEHFTNVNNEVKSFSIRSQIQYEKSIAEQLQSAPKLFHSYVRCKRIARPSIGPIRLSSGDLTDDPAKMADCLADSFSSVFDSSVPTYQYPHFSCSERLHELVITREMVAIAVSKIDQNASPGSDNIHPRLLKTLAADLCIPLTIIFNNSLRSGTLPRSWTESIVAPIYKKSSRYNALNYRPVSLTSVPCKVMERVLADYLWNFINTNNLISQEQYGFRQQHSTVDQLLCTYADITALCDQGKIVDLIFFDYAKAFDRVSHQILLAKLHQLGISNIVLEWIRCFLMRRTMKVRVAGRLSKALPVESGVPQGSVLGPILFLLYINHVIADIDCGVKIFADDIKIYLGIEVDERRDGETRLQGNINKLVQTSASWNLKINSDKCAIMRFAPSRSMAQDTGPSPYCKWHHP